jgi:hypothetical protein
MSVRGARWLAWSMCALAVALSISFIPLFLAVTRAASAPDTPFPPEGAVQMNLLASTWIAGVSIFVANVAFLTMGALIVSRYPTHTIGWLFCAYGLLNVVQLVAAFYAIYTLFVAPGALPGGLLAGWLQSWTWIVTTALLTAFLPLLFPTGRLMSARWKPAWWLAIGATTATALFVAFLLPVLTNGLEQFTVLNPFGLVPLSVAVAFSDLFQVLDSVLYVLLLTSILVAAASLVVRLRRAQGDELRQIKWFAYFAVANALLFVLQAGVRSFFSNSNPVSELALDYSGSLALIGLPIATGLAILRYRLFDIDVLIHRTLVYGTLTALLAGVYVGLVIGGQAVVQALTAQRGQQPVVIVATTLLVAGLFTPLRSRLQKLIDRRFYRRKYDAQRTLASFSATVRQEVSLTELRAHLLSVVEQTMQPSHVSLWLAPSRSQEPITLTGATTQDRQKEANQ